MKGPSNLEDGPAVQKGMLCSPLFLARADL